MPLLSILRGTNFKSYVCHYYRVGPVVILSTAERMHVLRAQQWDNTKVRMCVAESYRQEQEKLHTHTTSTMTISVIIVSYLTALVTFLSIFKSQGVLDTNLFGVIRKS